MGPGAVGLKRVREQDRERQQPTAVLRAVGPLEPEALRSASPLVTKGHIP